MIIELYQDKTSATDIAELLQDQYSINVTHPNHVAIN